MNFQQLRIIRETIRQKYNLTEAAAALYTSQSGVSKHIKDLEDELGVQLFIRKGKRLLGLTDPGLALSTIVDRMLIDADNIKRLAADFTATDEGELIIATTHTQACYVLPPIVARFKQAFPKVHLVLQQASPVEIAELVAHGEADIGIATESLTNYAQLASFPYYNWQHSLIVPHGHALTKQQTITLSDLAKWPLITYHGGFTGRSKIDDTFKQANLTPDIVMSALDADVIKTYIELGMGVGIVASIAFDPERDRRLQQIETSLFGNNTTLIAVRRNHVLRGFAYKFIELCNSNLDINSVREAALSEEV
ncbi:MAG: CysB family HTH-type transcriptional regulator [Gammaproteobacteria bacterium]|nr:CysB family HTH-type transcriptional regulator [Gammaproteobacteria bacterium]